jgi:hypothetical protein
MVLVKLTYFKQGCQNRTGRSDRSNREPDLHPVRLVRKTVLRGNRDQTGKTEIKPEKIGDPAGPTGLEV